MYKMLKVSYSSKQGHNGTSSNRKVLQSAWSNHRPNGKKISYVWIAAYEVNEAKEER
jgi:hypothetical protein